MSRYTADNDASCHRYDTATQFFKEELFFRRHFDRYSRMILSKRRPDERSSSPPSSPFCSSMTLHRTLSNPDCRYSVKTDTFDGKHAHPFHGNLSSRVPSRPRLQLQKWSRVRACLVTVTLAESELIYESNLTLEIEVIHPFRLILLSCLGVSTLRRETAYPSRVHHMYAHTLSLPRGTRGDSWREVYTPFEDKCTHTILMQTSLLTLY